MSSMRMPSLAVIAGMLIALGLAASPAEAVLITLSDPSGLSAEVEFTLLGPTSLMVRVRNTSTGVPVLNLKGDPFDNADQLLTSVSWDFVGNTTIIGGSVVIGSEDPPNLSNSINFVATGGGPPVPHSLGPGDDVGGEYGFGNSGTTGLLPNFISGNQAGTVARFDTANWDGPEELNGPQGGLVADPILIPLGGLGAIQNEIVATLDLDGDPLANLNFVTTHGVIVEFGSDAYFLTFVPEPSSIVMVSLAGLLLVPFARRRLRRGTT